MLEGVARLISAENFLNSVASTSRYSSPYRARVVARERFGLHQAAPPIEGLTKDQAEHVHRFFSRYHYGSRFEHAHRLKGTYDENGVQLNLFENNVPFEEKVLNAKQPVYDTCIGLAVAAYYQLKPVLESDFHLEGAEVLAPECFNQEGDVHVILKATPKQAHKGFQPVYIDPSFKKAGNLDSAMRGYKVVEEGLILPLYHVDNPLATVAYDRWAALGFMEDLMPSQWHPGQPKTLVSLGFHKRLLGHPTPVIGLKQNNGTESSLPVSVWLKRLRHHGSTDPIAPLLQRLASPHFYHQEGADKISFLAPYWAVTRPPRDEHSSYGALPARSKPYSGTV